MNVGSAATAMDSAHVAILLVLLPCVVVYAIPGPCVIRRVPRIGNSYEFNPFEVAEEDDLNSFKAAICKEEVPATTLPTDLEVLYLSGVNFPDKSFALRKIFKGLPRLVSVAIERCNIAEQSTSALFRHNAKLRHLSITQCVSGENFPAANMLQFCPDLEDVILASSGIKSVPATLLRSNTNLKRLDLSQNEFSAFDESMFAANAHLVTLTLHGNHISTLQPLFLTDLAQLEVFDASNNNLDNLPSNLFAGNPALQTAIFDGNTISNLPNDVFSANRRLRSVNFSNNRLRKIPPGIFRNCPELFIAKFANNAIPTRGLPSDLLIYNPEIFFVAFSGNAGMLPQLATTHHGIKKEVQDMIIEYGYDTDPLGN